MLLTGVLSPPSDWAWESIDRKIAHNDHTIMDYGDVWTIIRWTNIDHARVNPDDENSAIDMDKLWRILIDNWDNTDWVK